MDVIIGDASNILIALGKEKGPNARFSYSALIKLLNPDKNAVKCFWVIRDVRDEELRPEIDNFLKSIEKSGFEIISPVTLPVPNDEWDDQQIIHLIKHYADIPSVETITLISGDSGYVTYLEDAQNKGKKTVVASINGSTFDDYKEIDGFNYINLCQYNHIFFGTDEKDMKPEISSIFWTITTNASIGSDNEKSEWELFKESFLSKVVSALIKKQKDADIKYRCIEGKIEVFKIIIKLNSVRDNFHESLGEITNIIFLNNVKMNIGLSINCSQKLKDLA